MKKVVFILGLCILAVSYQVQAAVISSDTFTFGIGATSTGNPVWTGSENAGTNSSPVNGDFSLVPSGSSSYFSGTGPIFSGMTLSDGGSDVSGDSVDFVLNVTGSYTGTPGDAAAIPNYRVVVEIQTLSIYGAAWAGLSTGDFRFTETTAGHVANSPAAALNTISSLGELAVASNYTLLTWNPGDYEVAGTSFTRTFTLPPSDFAIDGLTIQGKVHVIYDAVPEPMTLSLLAMGGLGILIRRRK